MLKVIVSQVGCDVHTGNAVVLLNEPGGEKMLPIWIGVTEATAISWALQNIKTERPLTHQLLFNTIKSLNFEVEKVQINAMKDQAFLAELYLVQKTNSTKDGEEQQEIQVKIIDARPSDAIAVALLASAPIYVSPVIFERASVPVKFGNKEKAKSKHDDSPIDEELFKQFLQNVKASDFTLSDDQSGK